MSKLLVWKGTLPREDVVQTLRHASQQWLKVCLLPLIGIVIFLGVWSLSAQAIQTSLGAFPGPVAVWQQAVNLWQAHRAERDRADAFYVRQEQRIAARQKVDPEYQGVVRAYTGAPTFIDQVVTSLYTVLVGFSIATVIAVPLGIVCGLSPGAYAAMNPLIQLFKPVSPLAWLPLVTMVVSATYVSADPWFSKSFLTSAMTVALCCLWPTVVNTAVGVSSVPRDWLNVSRVLRLGTYQHIYKVVLPASIPMIFTGLRLSLGIGWMVLIAAEMLAQNPGLGKFVWDEFQNGSSNSLARILVAVLVIGLIGLLLDQLMLRIQQWVNWDKSAKQR